MPTVLIEGRRIATTILGRGEPLVIFEAGLGCGKDSWGGVPERVGSTTRVLAYDRPGIGESDLVAGLRSADELLSTARALVARIGGGSPIILVGHSFGGMLAAIWAASYPKEVVGLVMVDPGHPGTWEAMTDLLAEVHPDEGADVTGMREELDLALTGESDEEQIDFDDVGTRLRALDHIPCPATVLTAGPLSGSSRLGGDRSERLHDIERGLHADLVNLSPDGRQIVLPTAQHFIQDTHPDEVTAAILHMVAQVSGETGS